MKDNKNILKLDLHTHCFEAMRIPLPHLVTKDSVENIIASVSAKGLDGIAITEHGDPNFGFKAREIALTNFSNEPIIIIPGQEIYSHGIQIVELYLPNDTVFRFLPHPISIDRLDGDPVFNKIQGIEIDNYSHDRFINKQKVRDVAQKHNLLLLSNSDAHDLADIGGHYTEISMDELFSRATPPAH